MSVLELASGPFRLAAYDIDLPTDLENILFPLGLEKDRRNLALRISDLTGKLKHWKAGSFPQYLAKRAQIGSLALWHMCQILVLVRLLKNERAYTPVQTSATAILELCFEVGDKIEHMNWVGASMRELY